MRGLQQRFHEASAQYLDDVDRLIDHAYDSAIRLRLDSLGPKDQEVAFDLLVVAEVADASPHFEDRRGASMVRQIAERIGAGLKAQEEARVECGSCEAGWQVPFYAASIGARR